MGRIPNFFKRRVYDRNKGYLPKRKVSAKKQCWRMNKKSSGGDQGFSEEERATAERAHSPIGAAMHITVKHPSWTGGPSERRYMYIPYRY